MKPTTRNLLVSLAAIAVYVLCTFLCEFLGFLSPWGWLLFAVPAAFLAAFPVFYAYHRTHNRFLYLPYACVWALLMLTEWNELTLTMIAGILACGIAAELLYMLIGRGTRRARLVSYPVFALAPMSQVLGLWTNPQTYCAIAVGEMGSDYSAQMYTLSAPWTLLVALASTILAALLAALLADRLFLRPDKQ